MVKIPMQAERVVARFGEVIQSGPEGCCCVCSMPEQITLALSGFPLLHIGQAALWNDPGYIDSTVFVQTDETIYDECGLDDATMMSLYSCGGFLIDEENPSAYLPGSLVLQDAELVLDLTTSVDCEEYVYEGVAETPPSMDGTATICSSENTLPVVVRFKRECDGVAVAISPPTKGVQAGDTLAAGVTATAVALVNDGTIAGLNVVNIGSGYAKFLGRTTPEATGTVPGSTAQFTLSFSLYPQDPPADPIYYVSGITVTDVGQSNYTSADSAVVIFPENISLGPRSTVGGDPSLNPPHAALTAAFNNDGQLQSVSIQDGGIYWKWTTPVEADVPLVAVGSYLGQNATATANVDVNIDSPTFGSVTSITVTNPGSNYGVGQPWLCTIELPTTSCGVEYKHRAAITGIELSPPDCYQAIASRVVVAQCPTELLKSYDMVVDWGDEYGYAWGAAADGLDWCDSELAFSGVPGVYKTTGPLKGLTCTLAAV